MSDNDKLRELGKQLPWDKPDAARREAVRSQLLVAAAEGSGRVKTRWGVVGGAFAAGALAAAAAAMLVVRSDKPASAPAVAQIEASTGADFERQKTAQDEVVRVHRGQLVVAGGAPGAHVHVATADADVDGAGSYEVAVVDDKLSEVSVRAGSASVRVTGQQAVFLAAGETWKAKPVVISQTFEAKDPLPAPIAPLPPAPAPSVIVTPTRAEPAPTSPAPTSPTPTSPAISSAPTPATASSPPTAAPPATGSGSAIVAVESPLSPPAANPKSELERHFQDGYALLKANKPADAAREFGAAADAGGDAPLAADARYFEAMALVRAGRKTEAERALVAFLDRAPHSLRRGRATLSLARLIAERGDSASARNWYNAALGDPDPDVAAAARAALTALPK